MHKVLKIAKLHPDVEARLCLCSHLEAHDIWRVHLPEIVHFAHYTLHPLFVATGPASLSEFGLADLLHRHHLVWILNVTCEVNAPILALIEENLQADEVRRSVSNEAHRLVAFHWLLI